MLVIVCSFLSRLIFNVTVNDMFSVASGSIEKASASYFEGFDTYDYQSNFARMLLNATGFILIGQNKCTVLSLMITNGTNTGRRKSMQLAQ